MRLYVVIGNSSLRYVFASGVQDLGGSARRVDWEPNTDLPDLSEVLARIETDGSREVIAATVRDDRWDVLRSALAREGRLDVRVAGRDFAVPLENAYVDPRELGVDRLLSALAVHAWRPDVHGAAIDFGTALTVSVVSPGGVFLGGTISPGPRAAARGLHLLAPRLPLVSPPAGPVAEIVARSTGAGITAGIFTSIMGGLEYTLSRLRERFPGLVVVATGGAAEPYVSSLGGIDLVDPWLALRGLVLAAESAP